MYCTYQVKEQSCSKDELEQVLDSSVEPEPNNLKRNFLSLNKTPNPVFVIRKYIMKNL
jgi:hypothetical protein